jgi:hypothetical protein
MKVELESVAKLHFGLQDLIKEVVDGGVVVLLVDHVEARDEVGPGVSLDNGVKLGLDMGTSEHLQTADNDLHSEDWEPRLNSLEALLENGELLL